MKGEIGESNSVVKCTLIESEDQNMDTFPIFQVNAIRDPNLPGNKTDKPQQATTQVCTISTRVSMREYSKSSNPLLSCIRLMEDYVQDIWFLKVQNDEGYKVASFAMDLRAGNKTIIA